MLETQEEGGLGTLGLHWRHGDTGKGWGHGVGDTEGGWVHWDGGVGDMGSLRTLWGHMGGVGDKESGDIGT